MSQGASDQSKALWVACWMALGFHPQSYPGTMVVIWLGRGGRAEGLWDSRRPRATSASQKHLPNLRVDEWGGVGSSGVAVSDLTHLLSPVTTRPSHIPRTALIRSICTKGKAVLPAPRGFAAARGSRESKLVIFLTAIWLR